MKKFFYSALALVAIAGCAKDVIPAEEVVPQGETVTITAAMAQTKTTESAGTFSWNSDETISVGTSDEEYVAFDVDNAETGTFKHTFDAAAPELLLAVSPAQANASFGDASIYEVELPALYNDYVQGQTNALMIGIPDPQTANKFLFSHAAALIKVTYANVPAGTAGFKLTADANITGTVTLGGTSVSDIEIANTNAELDGKEVYINLAQPVAEAGGTLSFYVPVPTGNYSLLTIALMDSKGEEIASSVKTMNREGKTPLTLARTDVFNFPTITLEDVTKYYVKVTSSDDLVNGQYLIVYEDGPVAFNGGLETLDAINNTIEVTIEDGKIVSTETIDAAAFTISVDNGTVLSASGNYIGVDSNSNGLKTSDDASAYSHTFSIDTDGNAIIAAAFSGSTMTLRYNSASNQNRFRYYKSGQQAIALYCLEGSATASKQPSGLAWSASTASASITDSGVEFTAPTLTLGHAHDITYSSSNTTVATIDAEGVITVNVAGETTISASFAGDDTYKAATVEYVLTVEDNRTNYEFESIADLNGLAADFSNNEEGTYSGKLSNAVVSYVPDTKNAIIKDESGSILVYDVQGHGLLQGQTFSGELSVTVKLYYTTIELTYIDAEFTGSQASVAPENMTLANLVGNFATYQNAYVKVDNLTVDSKDGKNIHVSNGDDTYVVYDNAGSSTAVAGDIISVVGTVADHNGINQIKVWASDQIVITQAHTPVVDDNYTWVKTAYSSLATGDIVVIVDATSKRAMSNNNGASSAPSATAVTIATDGSTLSEAPAETLQWTVTVSDGSYSFAVGSNHLYCTDTNNGVRVGTNDNSAFTFVNDSNGTPFLKNTETTRYIGVYNSQDWRCYTSINNNIKNTQIVFYKRVAN